MSGAPPTVTMPRNVLPPQAEAWLIAGMLQQLVPGGWTVVGGQMVQFHGWRAGATPTRTTTDLDAGIAVRADPMGFQVISQALQDLGLRAVPHPSGLEYRWVKGLTGGGQAQVDLLLPSGLGDRARLSVNGRPGVQSRGVQWATDKSQLWQLAMEGHQFLVPVPSLLGAVLAKASALCNSSDSDPDRHLSDLAFLAGVATAADLAEPLTPRQAGRVLKALDRFTSSGVEIRRLSMAMQRVLRA